MKARLGLLQEKPPKTRSGGEALLCVTVSWAQERGSIKRAGRHSVCEESREEDNSGLPVGEETSHRPMVKKKPQTKKRNPCPRGGGAGNFGKGGKIHQQLGGTNIKSEHHHLVSFHPHEKSGSPKKEIGFKSKGNGVWKTFLSEGEKAVEREHL